MADLELSVAKLKDDSNETTILDALACDSNRRENLDIKRTKGLMGGQDSQSAPTGKGHLCRITLQEQASQKTC